MPLSKVLTIGRKDRDIVLPVPAVSRQHGRIELFQDRPVFVDEGSANGSLVNGQPAVKPIPVDHNEIIDIGGFKLTVENDEDFGEATVMMKRPIPQMPPRPAAAPPAPPPRPVQAPAAPPRPAAAPPPLRPAAPPPPVARAASMVNVKVPVGDIPNLEPLEQIRTQSAKPAAPPPPKASDEFGSFLDLRNDATTTNTVVPRGNSPIRAAPGQEVSAAALFEQQLHGIRSHRDEAHQKLQSRGQQLDQEWAAVAVEMHKLQGKLKSDARVQHFVVSRDAKEVTIKIASSSEKRGYRYFVLSRHHPEGKYPEMDAVWLREFGREDANFREPAKAMTELVQRIAGALA